MQVSPKIMKMIKRKSGVKHEPEPREEKTLKCGAVEFQIYVSPGQEINAKKMCKKLLKNKYIIDNGNKNSFVSKGYQGQRPY